MQQTLTLLKYDWLMAKAWFSEQRASKVMVMLASVGVFVIIINLLYRLSNGTFHYMAIYKEYGEMTSRYLVQVGLVVMSWFALVMATLAIFGQLHNSRKQLNFLFSQPLVKEVLPSWMFIKTVSMNSALLIFFMTPVFVAYKQAFLPNLGLEFLMISNQLDFRKSSTVTITSSRGF